MLKAVDPTALAKYDHLIGGICSGIASTAVCHPLDLLKTRFSGAFFSYPNNSNHILANEGSNPLRPKYTGYYDATRQIVRLSGLRGLYKGFIPNVTGNALAWGLFFPVYATLIIFFKESLDTTRRRK